MENSTDLAQQLAAYDAKRKSSVDVLNEAMGKYGVPEIRNRVSGLRTTLTNTENALNAVDPSVTGRTQGSLVTEAQRQRQVTNERAPIAEQYGTFSRSLGDAQANLTDQERAAQMLAEGQLNDYESGRTALAGRYQLANDREAEQRRREEADRAYQLQVQEAARQAKASTGYNFGSGTTQSAQQAPAASVDPQTQKAYNDVKNLLSKDAGRIQREYDAIRKSAGFGNAYDKVKLQLIEQLYPSVKSFVRTQSPSALIILPPLALTHLTVV
jgi:hypothetical protein